MSSIESIVGPLDLTEKQIFITSGQATALESTLGLIPGSLQFSNVLSIIEGIPALAPRSPITGNTLFLGGGKGLPGGGSELVIDSIPSTGGQGIKQIIIYENYNYAWGYY